ncbi:hypothetical protein FOZ60_005184 [Perkinsus olseni]|uniref:Uncharacterized protein n=1 Tax=Perkinsus olseni TaxID=32597 RepID=A0A7J6PGL1_PEROL|nr:hypothetical protein FOZ60_005184 [Perkinsus olseni]
MPSLSSYAAKVTLALHLVGGMLTSQKIRENPVQTKEAVDNAKQQATNHVATLSDGAAQFCDVGCNAEGAVNFIVQETANSEFGFLLDAALKPGLIRNFKGGYDFSIAGQEAPNKTATEMTNAKGGRNAEGEMKLEFNEDRLRELEGGTDRVIPDPTRLSDKDYMHEMCDRQYRNYAKYIAQKEGIPESDLVDDYDISMGTVLWLLTGKVFPFIPDNIDHHFFPYSTLHYNGAHRDAKNWRLRLEAFAHLSNELKEGIKLDD